MKIGRAEAGGALWSVAGLGHALPPAAEAQADDGGSFFGGTLLPMAYFSLRYVGTPEASGP